MISLVLLIFLLITCIGVILIRSSTSENRPFTLLPAGMIWGVTVYIFLLNLISKFLPGSFGIIVSTFFLIILGLTTYLVTYKNNVKLEKPSFITLIIISSLILTVIYLSRLKMTSIFPSADSNMQWAYAASFARGNFPLKSSWQPDLNPNYHLGAYFFEGAILSLSKLPLITINALLNTYFLIAGSLLAIFIFWETKYSFKNLWLVTASLMLYISFGVIMFIFPTMDFFNSIHTPLEIFQDLSKYPTGILAKGQAGASLVDLNSLSYLPARSLSIGLAFLALFFVFVPFKNINLKILSLAVLFATTALVEESMFLPLFLVGITILPFVRGSKIPLLKLLLLSAILVILQGDFFSNLLSQHDPAFHINLPFLDPSFMEKLNMLKSFTLSPNSNLFNWFLPSPLWFVLIVLIYAFLTKNRNLILVGLYSITSFFCFLLIEYKYYPSNNIRFYNFGYISAGISLIYLLFYIMRSKTLILNLLIFIVLSIFVLIPSLLPEILNQSQQINNARSTNIRSQILINSIPSTPFEKISDWASTNLPPNSRLFVIDTTYPTPNRSLQFEYKGLYTTLGPQYIRVMRQEPGIEFFDLALTLNPSILKQTKTGYIYIESESEAYKQLPQFRKEDLSNKKYFEILQSIDVKNSRRENIFYRLYKVNPEYLDSSTGGKYIEEGTLTKLQKLIPENVSTYIADYSENPKLLSFWYRMAIILLLKDRDIRRNLSQTDYMIIETYIPYKSDSIKKQYDYYVMGPNQKPSYPSKLIWSNIFATAWKKL